MEGIWAFRLHICKRQLTLPLPLPFVRWNSRIRHRITGDLHTAVTWPWRTIILARSETSDARVHKISLAWKILGHFHWNVYWKSPGISVKRTVLSCLFFSYAVRVLCRLWATMGNFNKNFSNRVWKCSKISWNSISFFHTQVMSRLRSYTPSDNHYTARLRAGGSPHGSQWRSVNATTGKFIASIAAEVKLHSYILLIVTN